MNSLMVVALLLSAAPKTPPVNALTEVKVGDYVEYAMTDRNGGRPDKLLLRERSLPMQVRLTAVEVTGGKLVHVSANYETAIRGDEVAFTLGGKPWRLIREQSYAVSVLSEIERMLGSSDWPPTTGGPTNPLQATPGPPCEVGPKKVATSQLKIPESGRPRMPNFGKRVVEAKLVWLITFFTDPKSVPEAPLPVRYGIIQEDEIEGSPSMKVVEWK